MAAYSRRHWRHWLPLLLVAMLATACGILPGTSSGDDNVSTLEDGTEREIPTLRPTATPTTRPTVTPRPTATPRPTPTPTPDVPDSYTRLLSDVRGLFSSPELEADIARLVPLPYSLPIPPDAQLERVDLGYRQWTVWQNVVGGFPPVDTPADVSITVAFLTDQEVDTLREAFAAPILADGYVVESDDSESGVFSDVQYELNGGVLQRGRDGAARVTIFGQADATFVEVSLAAELTEDPSPRLTRWPELFTVPFSGGFQDYSTTGVKTSQGIEVGAAAVWLIGSRGSSQTAILETLVAEYPANGVIIEDVVETGSGDAAVATLKHPTGSSGSVTVDFAQDYTFIDFVLGSLPG